MRMKIFVLISLAIFGELYVAQNMTFAIMHADADQSLDDDALRTGGQLLTLLLPTARLGKLMSLPTMLVYMQCALIRVI